MATLSCLFSVLTLIFSFQDPRNSYHHQHGCKPARDATHKALFVFGDSLFDPGNNQYLNDTVEGFFATSWPYGQTFFNRPTGRLSDGRILPDFIAQFAKLPILGPYLEPGDHRFTDGINFASAGAGVLVETHPGTIHLRKQLEYFKTVRKSLKKQLGDAEAVNFLNKAVFLFSIGGNDYFDFFTKYPEATELRQKEFSRMVIGNLTMVLKELYGLGARKVAVQNAGPLGCLPSMKSMNPDLGDRCAEEPLALARLHNSYLSTVLHNMEIQLSGFKYAIFDYYNSLGDRVYHPWKYGFKEGKGACCGSGTYRGGTCGGGISGNEPYEVCSDPSEYVWFDGGHTTEMANYQLAELLWTGPITVTAPYNVKQLFQ